METVRSFIALDLPQDVKQKLAGVIDRLSAQVDGVRWVRPENLHLTLRFLGNVELDRLDQIAGMLRALGPETGPAALSLGDIGAFPRVDRARVIWVGLEGDVDRLSVLQQGIEAGLGELGFEREKRAFRPHLTLGRARSGEIALDAIDRPADMSFTLPRLILMQSDLGPGGARYTPLEIVELGG